MLIMDKVIDPLLYLYNCFTVNVEAWADFLEQPHEIFLIYKLVVALVLDDFLVQARLFHSIL